MFEIEMLPAREGDCLWIRYGDAKKPRQILIDGGRAATGKELKRRLATLPEGRRDFELLIVTHIDRDHIEGTLGLLEDPDIAPLFKDVWFNGFDHLRGVKVESFGGVQGERLTAALLNRLPWNKKWRGQAVCLGKSGLKSIALPGGLKLTLFSPDKDKLAKLIPVWKKECEKAGLVPGQAGKPSEKTKKGIESFGGGLDIEQLAVSSFKGDPGEPNGTSIAVLAEYDGKRALLTGDAHVDRLIDSIKMFKATAKRLKLDAFKVAHHGSENNVSHELVELLDCPRYLISTNGSYFKHPTAAAVARLIKFGGKKRTLFFNYKTKFTELWDAQPWKEKYSYDVVYPDNKQNGTLTVSL